jgi:phage host-nuclease inhibitor protein Gam
MTTTIDETFAEVEALLNADAEQERKARGAAEDDYSWVPDWILKQQVDIEAERKALHEQYEVRVGQLRAKEAAIINRWAKIAGDEVRKLLAGGKKKSIDLEYGRAGFRTVPASKKLDVYDEGRAIEWALANNAMEALKTTVSKTALKPYIEKGATVDGVEVIETPAHETFYIGSLKFSDETGD